MKTFSHSHIIEYRNFCSFMMCHHSRQLVNWKIFNLLIYPVATRTFYEEIYVCALFVLEGWSAIEKVLRNSFTVYLKNIKKFRMKLARKL